MKSDKKIYYIANARMPTEKAHGIQLAKMCEAFVEHGVDLELIVPRRKTSEISLKDFYGLAVDIPVTKIPVIDWYINGRIGFFIGSVSFAVGYFFYLWAKRLRGEGFIVYMTDIDQFSFFLIPFFWIPYFCEIHDAKQKRFPFTLLFRHAAGIITINGIIKKELSETFSIAPAKIIVHPNGIDMRMFASRGSPADARNILRLPRERFIALYTGRFYDWKGLDIAVDAAQLLDKEMELYLVGGGAEELMRVTGTKELPQSLHCMGHRKFTEIPMWLFAADVVLVFGTQRNDYSYLHTSPMKFFEYMASKRPIIASRTPANREIVTEDDALMYEPDNAEDLAEKIRYAYRHRDEMEERAEHAFEKVGNFSWDKRSLSIMEFMGISRTPRHNNFSESPSRHSGTTI